ncbi:hypothetical protein [Pseudaeromonas pectinilytica]
MSQTLNGLPLGQGENLIWSDELDWTPLEQTKTYGQTGMLLQQSGVKKGGRPVTLTGDWVTREQLDALIATQLLGTPLPLVLGNRTFSVYWDATQKPIEASPILGPDTEPWEDPNLQYEVTYRFFTAE